MFRIETPRCLISAWKNDAREQDMLRRWTNDAGMMRYISGAAWTDADRSEFFERQRRMLENAGVCFGVAESRQSNRIVGIAGLALLELVDDWQIGWWVDPDLQGEGLGTEFARALVDYALNTAGRSRVVAVISPDNIASRRVAEKAGMRFAATVRANTLESRWKDEDVVLYESHADHAVTA